MGAYGLDPASVIDAHEFGGQQPLLEGGLQPLPSLNDSGRISEEGPHERTRKVHIGGLVL